MTVDLRREMGYALLFDLIAEGMGHQGMRLLELEQRIRELIAERETLRVENEQLKKANA